MRLAWVRCPLRSTSARWKFVARPRLLPTQYRIAPLSFCPLGVVPDVRCELQSHQGALCCIVIVGLLLFLNRKTEKTSSQSQLRMWKKAEEAASYLVGGRPASLTHLPADPAVVCDLRTPKNRNHTTRPPPLYRGPYISLARICIPEGGVRSVCAFCYS
jgi:hypothetical protein